MNCTRTRRVSIVQNVFQMLSQNTRAHAPTHKIKNVKKQYIGKYLE